LSASDPDTLRISFTAVTPADEIQGRCLCAGPARGWQADHSSVAIYSGSRIGYSDLGTNAKRVKELLELIGTR
jgi:hypothetical protein